MSIIAVLNPKGGCGKTTLATHLAIGLHLAAYKVLLIDSDPQGTARDWHCVDENNPVPLVAVDRPQNFKTLPQIARQYDFVIIDGAAKLETMLAAAIKVADLVLIPVQPSPFDLWATNDLVELIETRQTLTDGQPAARFVINRLQRNTRLGQDIFQALEKLAVPAFSTVIHQRQSYPRSANNGLCVLNTPGNPDPIARLEIQQLLTEIQQFFGIHYEQIEHIQ